MVFNLFKKKRSINEDRNWRETLNLSLKNSFYHVKEDINKLLGKLKSLEEAKSYKFEETDRRLKLLEAYLINNQKGDKQLEEEDLPISTSIDITNTQKAFLLRLKLLLDERGANWILMRELAEDLYPSKNYDSIKSMISNYIDVLSNLNLIKKLRKGRSIYLTLTEKARKSMPKNVRLSKIKKKTKKKT